MKGKRLTRRFYRRDPVTVAKALLGQELVRILDDGTELSGRIVETEAYLGVRDKAAHSYGGRRTKRNESMYLDGGHAYVYFIYGMHWCFNVVSDRERVPTACLIRALEPLGGLEEMRRRRGYRADEALCSGPAKLSQALGIDRALDGIDMTMSERLFICSGANPAAFSASPRIGVGYSEDWAAKPLRFWIEENPHVSRTKKTKGPARSSGA